MREIIEKIKQGKIGVLPTDTLYGLVGSALNKRTVEKIYHVRKREAYKPFIILIHLVADLKKFGVKPNKRTKDLLKKLWPGSVSIIFPINDKRQATRDKFAYLHRGTHTLAFRLPKPLWLRKLLQKTGPLVAPSANISGKPLAFTIAQARKYFGENVDFYVDKGMFKNPPSSLIEIKR